MQGNEERAIKALQEVARIWPKSLWLFSASGTLWVMKKQGGVRAIDAEGGMDRDAQVTAIDIESDGGDW